MRRFALAVLPLVAGLVAPLAAQTRVPAELKPNLDQPMDADATAKIRKYTTAPEFNSPLTDYLPASATVPSPGAVLGRRRRGAGNPSLHGGREPLLPHARRGQPAGAGYLDRHERGRARAHRGGGQLGREPRASERERRAADAARGPRLLKLDDKQAEDLITASVPIYFITGTIHSPETGAPTALMELAYRLAVDESPYIRSIREHVITLITPVVEVDGRDRMVDVYRWHLAHPKAVPPHLVYWGHYVAHDNNRDAMGMTLSLTRQVLDTYLGWHARCCTTSTNRLPFLYDNTVGDGPYNALDRSVAHQRMATVRLVERGADGQVWNAGRLHPRQLRHLEPGLPDVPGGDAQRRLAALRNLRQWRLPTPRRARSIPTKRRAPWYRQDPPYRSVSWSQRNNNNYEQTGSLVSLAFVAENREMLLRNFWEKSKRSITKPEREDRRRTSSPPTTNGRAPKPSCSASCSSSTSRSRAPTKPLPCLWRPRSSRRMRTPRRLKRNPRRPRRGLSPPASYVVRMDQPFSRSADALLDRQYWSPDDPQKRPYDDTGWCFPALFGTEAVRWDRSPGAGGADEQARSRRPAAWRRSPAAVRCSSSPSMGTTRCSACATRWATPRWRLPRSRSKQGGTRFRAARGWCTASPRMRWRRPPRRRASRWKPWLPRRKSRRGRSVNRASRCCTPGSARRPKAGGAQRLDLLKIPYNYISTQDVAADAGLGSHYDVILFPPVGFGDPQRIVSGLPMWGEPMPWKTTPETPNLGRIAATDDERPALASPVSTIWASSWSREVC